MTLFTNAIADAVETFEKLAAVEPDLLKAANIVRTALLGGNKLLVCGNGGSAADGADFAAEFGCRFTVDRKPFPAINLSNGGSLLTAIGNDYSFDEVFARQVQGYGRPGDVLVAISTSGNSRNIFKAIEMAQSMDVRSIALLGRDGGFTKGAATVDLVVPGNVTARIQEGHKFLLHNICALVDPDLQKL
jgi:phosphoheptose isomerase